MKKISSHPQQRYHLTVSRNWVPLLNDPLGRPSSLEPTTSEKILLRSFFSWVLAVHNLKDALPTSVHLEVLPNGEVKETHTLGDLILYGDQALAVELMPEICFAEAWLWRYEHDKEAALISLAADSPDAEPFFNILTMFGRLALMEDPRLEEVLLQWRQRYLETGSAVLREVLKKADDEIFFVGPGDQASLLPAERVAIANDCIKWGPLCEGLNTDLKRLGNEPVYLTSNLLKKEACGLLAEKYAIPIKDVKLIKDALVSESRNGRGKATPREAMCALVARAHGVSPQTVEKIYGDLLELFPKLRKKKSSSSTLRMSALLPYLPITMR